MHEFVAVVHIAIPMTREQVGLLMRDGMIDIPPVEIEMPIKPICVKCREDAKKVLTYNIPCRQILVMTSGGPIREEPN